MSKYDTYTTVEVAFTIYGQEDGDDSEVAAEAAYEKYKKMKQQALFKALQEAVVAGDITFRTVYPDDVEAWEA